MMLLTNRTAATRRDIASMTLRCGPSAAALGYPLALVLLHQSGRQFVQATDATSTLLAGFAVCVTVVLVYIVPVLSFAVILRSGGDIRARRLAHLAFAAPPLFTVIGVVFFFLGIPNGDYVVWTVAWLGVLAYAASASPAEAAPAPPATWVRTAHGITGATILVIFLVWHLANHALAMFSPDANNATMLLLRTWYRSGFVQPILLALFLWQLATGARLLWAKIAHAGDVYSSIQTATAGYLLVYIPSHLIAIFILGRWFLGVDTTFEWASGAPSGLLLDAWNVRLIPHYSLAVLFVVGHLAMGLRAILVSHGVRVALADRTSWTICSIGLALSLVIAVAQLRVGA
jgi:succinate dehydrogenase/fumarate reductase cytochrome b subunit